MADYFPQPLPVGSWDDAQLAPIAEVNEQTLQILRTMATEPRGEGHCRALPRLVSTLREDWRRLDVKGQRRLSGCPYLLLDAQFSQSACWDQVLFAGVKDAPPRSGGYFTGRAGVALIRRSLLLAWHLARSNRLMATITLGLTPAVAERIAASRLNDLEAIAERTPPWIVPRWENRPAVWQQLMTAARSPHPLALRQAQLRGLQLLAQAHTRA
jgi:hypothetical protein